MSGTTLPIYRLPIASAPRIGAIRVVLDRNRKIYVAGSKVASATPSGDFLILTLANGDVYYVKTQDYERLQSGQRK